MSLYCTIVTGGYGAPHRYYRDANAALRAAQRHCKLRGAAVEVAWCKYPGNPKLWLARVTPEGATLMDCWAEVTQPQGEQS